MQVILFPSRKPDPFVWYPNRDPLHVFLENMEIKNTSERSLLPTLAPLSLRFLVSRFSPVVTIQREVSVLGCLIRRSSSGLPTGILWGGTAEVRGDGLITVSFRYLGQATVTFPIFFATLFLVLLHNFWGIFYEAPTPYPDNLSILPNPGTLMPTPSGSAHTSSQTNFGLFKQL